MFPRLLTWLKSFFIDEKSPSVSPSIDLFKPDERLIFSFWDGEKTVNADPMVLNRRLMNKWAELTVDINIATSTLLQHKEVDKARNNIVKASREIFNLKSPPDNSLDCSGMLTEVEAMDLLNRFREYVGDVKKNSSTSPISSTDESSVTQPSSASESVTTNGSDSTSIASEVSTDKPT